MNNNEISFPRKLTNQLLHLAQLSPETEICGLIAADQTGMPCCCYPVNNNAVSPGNRFLMDPGQQIAAMKHMRENGDSLFAIYHSHPFTPAIPSSADIDQAVYPEALHFIISLSTKGVLELRAYRIVDKNHHELCLSLIDD